MSVFMDCPWCGDPTDAVGRCYCPESAVARGIIVVPDPVPRELGPRIDLMKALDDSLKAPRRACLALAALGFAFQRIADNDTTHRAIKRANWGWARTESKKLANAILCALHDDVDEAIDGTPELPEEGA